VHAKYIALKPYSIALCIKQRFLYVN